MALAIVIASASFVLLTASVRTSEARIEGDVAANFRATYDLLVRPNGSQSELERAAGLVRPNFETSIYGGITETQWHQILDVPGVEVAAPVAYAGFGMLFSQYDLDVTEFVGSAPAERLFRLKTTWLANGGLSRYPGTTPYLYVTTKSGGCKNKAIIAPSPGDPFAWQSPEMANLACFERVPGKAGPSRYTVVVNPQFSMLMAGIDPVQESALVGLDRAITWGRSLITADEVRIVDGFTEIPMMAPDRTDQDESLAVTVESVAPPAGSTLAQVLDEPRQGDLSGPNPAYRRVAALPGRQVGSFEVPYDELYRDSLVDLKAEAPEGFRSGFSVYWHTGPVRYTPDSGPAGSGPLQPRVVDNDPEAVWRDPTGTGGTSADGSRYYALPAPDNQDVGFRELVPVEATIPDLTPGVYPKVWGTFDPSALTEGGSRLAQVPLQTYAPPLVTAANHASSEALGGKPLGPTANIAGYVSQPAALLTTLAGIQGLLDSKYFTGADAKAPISIIRVRVAGVTGPDEASLERLKRVAAAISEATGLTVDITAGSSPQPQTVALPAGRFGQPPLLVSEGWSRKGVAVVILDAVNQKSAALFGLILVVTAVFLTTATWTMVQSRRPELGILRALGWKPRHLATAMIVQTAVIGCLAGIGGASLAFSLIRVLDLQLPATRALLVIPVAVLLAIVASLGPALRAARTTPMHAITNPASDRGGGAVTGLTSLALNNLRRRPGRTAAASIGLVLGVGAVVILVAVTLAYTDVVTGTVLADFVRSSTRGVDYLAIGVVLLLAAVAIADVVALNVRERSAELAALRAFGWADRQVSGVIMRECVLLGVLASIPGAVLGLAVGSLTGVPITALLLPAAAAVLIGTVITGIAGLVPAYAAARRSISAGLSEE